MKKHLLILALLPLQIILAQTLFQTEPVVRVRIINTVDTLRILFNGNWLLSNSDIMVFSPADGEVMLTIEAGKVKIYKSGGLINLETEEFLLHSRDGRGTLNIKNVPFGVGWWWVSKEDRTYEGEFHFYVTKENKFEIVIHLPLEEYLKGVVPYEIGGDSPLEAIKAQAVAARSEAIMALNSKLYRGEHHDLTSDVECQVFSGNIKRTEISDRAVDETKGLILSERDKPINAYYASNCGGHSELIINVWGNRPGVESYCVSHFDSDELQEIDLSNENNLREWLFSNPPANCNPNLNSELPIWSKNNFRWKVEFATEAISRMTSKGKDLGNLVDIKILKRGESGRAYLAKFVFETDSIEVKGELKIRQMISPPLRSACFVVDKTDAGFVFSGAGWGHGVGMCQSGAITMARNGKGFEEILVHYYRSAELIRIY